MHRLCEVEALLSFVCMVLSQLKEFPEGTTLEGMRKAVGRFGITGKAQTQPILQLSDGLRSRLVFAWLAYKTPHILALVLPSPFPSVRLFFSDG